MAYDPDKHHRRSIRLEDYDYRQAGVYFVTLCTHDRGCLFGNIENAIMQPNIYGHHASNAWLWLEEQYSYVRLDMWVLMPNHLHGLLVITDDAKTETRRGASRSALHNDSSKRKSLGRLIGAYKTVSTKVINRLRDTPGARVWQRNYYEHIVRNEENLQIIRQYIETNPARWITDDLYVDG